MSQIKLVLATGSVVVLALFKSFSITSTITSITVLLFPNCSPFPDPVADRKITSLLGGWLGKLAERSAERSLDPTARNRLFATNGSFAHRYVRNKCLTSSNKKLLVIKFN